MNYLDWKRENHFITDKNVMRYLRKNLLRGSLPIVIFICPNCGEVLEKSDSLCYVCGNGSTNLSIKGKV